MSAGGMKCIEFLALSLALLNDDICAFTSFFPSVLVPKCPDGVYLCTLDAALSKTSNKTTFSEKVDVAFNLDLIRSVTRLKRRLLNKALAATGLVRRPLFDSEMSHEASESLKNSDSSRYTLDSGQSTESFCDERVEVLIPEVGQNIRGQWVLLGGDVEVTSTQCGKYASGPCQTVVNSRCSQRFGEISLPVINGNQYQVERIRVPCGCTCEIMPESSVQ
ncbi:uncharacterized protein LOC100905091 [Galendromus occidentalis]|uniref:Uncharacterized protein LOC100905091 n=1 Tax=Galendromus occidentalis TaxID=34638 RepID=A0AAJ6QSV0_9ACAR|nr:uncharacterized protein LOC100905091 [Galendromus occidentalis]